MKERLKNLRYVWLCPNCGYAMTWGASHSGSGSQLECHNCGYVAPRV